MKNLTPVAKKVLEYAEKQIRDANAELMVGETKRKEGRFSYWVQWNFERMVSAEAKLDLWTVVQRAILDDKSKIVTDDEIKAFLISYRNDIVRQIVQSTHKNSTNVIAVQIEILQEDARKNFVGSSCIDTGSMSALLRDAFGMNVNHE